MTPADIGLLRGLGTAFLLAAFVALCIWAWRPAQRRRFDEAAALPFRDDDDGREETAR